MVNYFNKTSFSGIVVAYNQERYLRSCLKSLTFCDQLVVVDLGSTDRSVDIARDCGSEIKSLRWVPTVEMVREEALKFSKFDWVVFIDPDEIFPSHIEDVLNKTIFEEPRTGMIEIPWRFFFKSKPLHCTIWGIEKFKGVVLHKNRVLFSPLVHETYSLVPGFTKKTIESRLGYFLDHYWVENYKQLFEKHWRYIQLEGKARYSQGSRFDWKSLFQKTLSALKTNLIDYRGLFGGSTGIFLSFFYAWYVSMSQLSLRRYEKQQTVSLR